MTVDQARDSDYEVARRYAREFARGYAVGTEWLPTSKQPHSSALLAFTMHTDNLADDGASPAAIRRARFNIWRETLLSVLGGMRGPDQLEWQLCRAFARTASEYNFSRESIDVYLDAQMAELDFAGFRTFAELAEHADALIGTTSVWANRLYGGTSLEAERRSRHMGMAAQLSDYLVDLKADLAQGRIYLPDEDLERFGVTPEDLYRSASTDHLPQSIKDLVMFQALRARDYCDSGSGWDLLVDSFARDVARLPEAVYRRQIERIIASGGDIFGDPPTRVEELGGRIENRLGLDSAPSDSVDVRKSSSKRGSPMRASAMPRHIGIVLDGNRRWARLHGVPIAMGHRRGESVLRELSVELLSRGVQYLSVFLFSTENWHRESEEVGDLMALLSDAVAGLGDTLTDRQIRLRFLGRSEGLPWRLRDAIARAERLTASHTGGTLAICVNYGGHAEIADACRKLLAEGVEPDRVSPEVIANYLYAPDIPAVDLLIRAGGERRLSNFMLWRAAYAELAFLPQLWPDVTVDHIDAVLADYMSRTRRFGS